jgi:hypothetical protein
MMWSENVCGESYNFDIEKSLAYTMCKECVVKALVLQLCPHVQSIS